MKANELRIGNWVTAPAFELPFKVDIMALYQSKHLNPIPLTSEILEMCGFVWDSEDNGDSLAESYVLDKFVWSVGLKEMYYNNEPLPHIEYLHQLQNLYFALTGKELKVNFHVEAAN